MADNTIQEEWTTILESTSSLFKFNFRELWRYRDLIILFVKRDIVSVYKQTILGPLWYVIQPLFASAVYVIFGYLAKIPTDELPRILFCLTGVLFWNYFSSCPNRISNTFISNLMSFFIQLLLIVPFMICYRDNIHPNIVLLAIPFLIVIHAMMGLGFGIIVSSLTIKHRDLIYLVSFAVQLAMYATPIIYPLSLIPGKFRFIASLNPLSPIIEIFRYGMLGKGTFTLQSILYSIVFATVIMFIGIVLFNRVEKDFVDTV